MTMRSGTGRAVYALFWLLGSLPLPWLHRFGAWLGRRRRGRTRRVVECNLDLVYPELDIPARQALTDAILAESGRAMLEAFRIWTRPRRALGWIVDVDGGELLDQARAKGRGVLVLAPHLGAWELLNLYLSLGGPGAVLYRAPAHAGMHWALVQARSRLGMDQIHADRHAPRALIKRLAAGQTIGILPDQQPREGEGVYAPFFGIKALTMTLAPRLAQRTTTLIGWAERLPHSAGFRLHFVSAPAQIADPDPVRAASAMNAAIEKEARRAPAQYAWTYKRFSLKPSDEPPRYTPDTRRRQPGGSRGGGDR